MTQERDIVLGLGATGYSVVRHLHAQHPLSVFDSRLEKDSGAIPFLKDVRTNYPDVDVIPPRSFKRALATARRVIASPGIPSSSSLVQWAQLEQIPIVGDIDLFMEQVRVPVVGVTGTNGKSSTVRMVADMLQQRSYVACGNIGTPVLDALESEAAGYVLELSSFQLERLQYGPFNVATILNITADHLDHHGSMEAYTAAKQQIYKHAEFTVYDRLRPETIPHRAISGIELNGDPKWRVREDGINVDGHFVSKSEICLNRAHNLQNLLAAAAISMKLGATIDEVVQVAGSFQGSPHSAQSLGTYDRVEYINDSKATNVGSAIASIQTQRAAGSDLILICGGDGKGVDFTKFGKCIDQCVAHAILLGRDAKNIASCIQHTSYEFVPSMAAAVVASRNASQAGDTVLLAPACGSLDMFTGFTHRGDVFEQNVLRIQR